MNIEIQGSENLHRGSKGAAALDLRARIDAPIVILPGETQMIPTGVKLNMTLEPGLCALVLPRSGLGAKQGLVLGNGIGLIDNDYQGEILVAAWNRNSVVRRIGRIDIVPGDKDVFIRPGDRIAQLMFLYSETPIVHLVEVEGFDQVTERGEGGFNSTGIA